MQNTSVPLLVGSEATMLLSAPVDEMHSPRFASDVISTDDMRPRDPWRDLAAGVQPRIAVSMRADRLLDSKISFSIAVPDLDWHGFELSGLDFALAMVQRVDDTMTGSIAQARVARFDLAWVDESSAWVGRVVFDVLTSRQLSVQSLVKAA